MVTPLTPHIKKKRRTYAPEDKAAALTLLDYHNGNVKRTARSAGIPRKTLSQWKEGKGVSAEVISLHNYKRTQLADEFENLIRRLLEAIPAKMEDAPLLDVMKSVGILVDKMQLLRGKPTKLIMCRSCRNMTAA